MTVQKLLNGDVTDRGEGVTIETDGNVFRPWLQTITALVKEAKIHADDDGLSVRAVDPANVGFVSTTLYADALDT